MSTQATISIKTQKLFKADKVLDDLIKSGWSYNDHGKIFYLPLHDVDYNWATMEIDKYEDFRKIISQKTEYNEIIGVTLIHNTLKSGGSFHLNQLKGEIMIIVSINRIKLPGLNITDFSSYLNELFKSLPSEIITLCCADE